MYIIYMREYTLVTALLAINYDRKPNILNTDTVHCLHVKMDVNNYVNYIISTSKIIYIYIYILMTLVYY